MAVKVSYTKYNNCPGASFWSFMETMGPILLGLAALFGALGISLYFDLKPVWSVLTFILCFIAAGVGIFYFLKLSGNRKTRALNRTWNQTMWENYEKETGKLPAEQIEILKSTPHAYYCCQCGSVAGYSYKYQGKCSNCKKPVYFTGLTIDGWNAVPQEQQDKVTSTIKYYRNLGI